MVVKTPWEAGIDTPGSVAGAGTWVEDKEANTCLNPGARVRVRPIGRLNWDSSPGSTRSASYWESSREKSEGGILTVSTSEEGVWKTISAVGICSLVSGAGSWVTGAREQLD